MTPPNCPATLQAIFHSFFFGLGIGVGELLGGYMYPFFGARVFFRMAAMLAAIACISYTMLWVTWLRKLEKRDFKLKDKEKALIDEPEMLSALVSGVQTEATVTLYDTNQINISDDEDEANVNQASTGLMPNKSKTQSTTLSPIKSLLTNTYA